MLDSEWLESRPDERRIQMLGTWHVSNDLWTEISRQRPQQAALRPQINRQIMLVAEKEYANHPDGVVIVHVRSDEKPEVLGRVSAGAEVVEADGIVKWLELWNSWEPPSYHEFY